MTMMTGVNMNDKPQTLEELVNAMTPEIHEQLKSAVELGRWENGERLTDEQKANCLQAIIAYDQANLSPEQRVGFVKPKEQPCGDHE